MEQSISRTVEKLGENTFGLDKMQEQLPREFFDKLLFAIRNHRPISQETADVIAHAMKQWAISKGATHYTHWFQPLTGLTAEKHDSFLSFDASGKPMDKFTGKQLIVSEPDASSFPHGGLRSTFEARGYAAWDPTSPAFIVKRDGHATLSLPSVFVSHKGEVLDKKTPLIRSVNAVGRASVKMLRLLGNKRVTAVTPYVGAEQEYFLVDRALFDRRPDLRDVGVTLLGAEPSRGQHMEDHYFGSIDDRVLDFMEEAEDELVRLGVPVKTRHNEVAPAQFELAVLHSPANIAADQNQLVMDVLRRVAPRHDFVALFHEKPYAKINGSGKHNNWSLIDSEGTNLLEPGINKSAHLRFLVFLTATISAVDRHSGLLSAVVANSGNDLRLGGNEAPPRITSVHLGDHLSRLLDHLVDADPSQLGSLESLDLGLGGVPAVPRDTTDRNRTSPFAFTGNKFEFRAVGSSSAISLPNVVINTTVAESLDIMAERIADRMEAGEGREQAVLEVVRETVKDSARCRYDGDCYTDAWKAEAERRGLFMAGSAPEALSALVEESSFSLFEKYGILKRHELEARYTIRLQQYFKTVKMELRVMSRMLATRVLPAAARHQRMLAESVNAAGEALGGGQAVSSLRRCLERTAVLVEALVGKIDQLKELEEMVDREDDLRNLARLCADKVRPAMAATRELADRIEDRVGFEHWTLPCYDELLFLR